MIIRDFEFDGSLFSLKKIIKQYGIDEFCINTGYNLNRVMKLYTSSLSDDYYIEYLLEVELGNFENEFNKILSEDKICKKEKNKNIKRNSKLIDNIKKINNKFCKIGIENIIIYLIENKNNLNDEIILLCLKIEYSNLLAKNSKGFLKKDYYKLKHDYIIDLCNLYKLNKLEYGYKDYNNKLNDTINSIIFFDTPAGQISWHSTINKENHPEYYGEWDQKESSTFNKLEKYIRLNYKYK